MSKPIHERVIETRRLADLKPHPSQANLFVDLSQSELERLAANIAQHGLDHPPEILPDGTVVRGHQRIRALKLLGREETEVIVRHDLAAAGPAAIEEALIVDNLDRRQMTPLEIARCYVALKQTAQLQPSEGDNTGDIRDRLAARFGLSGRTLDRLARVLQTPVAVQNAVARNELPLTQAERIAGLAQHEQAAIATRIAAREPAKAVVAAYLVRPAKQPSAADVLADVGRALERLAGLGLGPGDGASVPLLKRGKDLIESALSRIATKAQNV